MLLRDFTTKYRHSHAVFNLWVYIATHLPLFHPSTHTIDNLCSHWTNLPITLLEVTVWPIHAIAFKAAWQVLCRHWQLKGLQWPLHNFELVPSRAETYHVFFKDCLVLRVSLGHIKPPIYDLKELTIIIATSRWPTAVLVVVMGKCKEIDDSSGDIILLIIHTKWCISPLWSVLRYQSPATVSVTDDEPVVFPIVAWQVYCPSWDWRSGFMVRV